VAKIKDKNRIPEMKKNIQELSKKTVRVGVFEPGSLDYAVAMVHEYGTNIAVTNRMRGWFLAQGYPLPGETTHITIPERSFIRSTFDSEIDEIKTQVARAVGFMLDGDWDENRTARTVGAYLVGQIRERVESQFVMRTGDLRKSIKYRVE